MLDFRKITLADEDAYRAFEAAMLEDKKVNPHVELEYEDGEKNYGHKRSLTSDGIEFTYSWSYENNDFDPDYSYSTICHTNPPDDQNLHLFHAQETHPQKVLLVD